VKIALIGYGKMGREIEQLALKNDHVIGLIIDIENQHEMTVENLSKCDVAIEFTTPSSVIENLKKCFDAGIPVVTGTTGWNDKFEEISDLCTKKGQTLFHASNFSIGVNLFFATNRYLARLMNNFAEYNVSIDETHHTAKLDAPSGTAITTSDIISEQLKRKDGWTMDDVPADNKIHIKAFREGNVTGIHEVKYDSPIDFLEIKHSAKSRQGFVQGALMAAEFIVGKKGVFTMSDMLGL